MTLLKFHGSKWLMLVLLSFLSLNSCKYSFTGASISPEVKTISVDFFKSYAQLAPPVLEQSFTEALKEIFVSQTNLRLVESGGDLQFEGKIVGYQSGPISVGVDQKANQERLTITVQVKFTNLTDSKNDFDKSFSRFKDYDATQNLSSIETELIRDINDQLVQTIFDASVSNW
ncbi:MAG TPA: hypothetical protein DCX54_13760 [Flavobacteriales bacterium]|nr:hypothetical protein [Flavobacteriales bacterium]